MTDNISNKDNMNKDNVNKVQNKNTWSEIFVHDVEAAAFVIVSVMIIASVSSYAIDVSRGTNLKNPQKIERNPVQVYLKDMNGDGINDIVLTHQNGVKEIVLTDNK